MIKNRMQLTRFELALLHEIHDARNTGERERTVGDDRNRSMKFQPRICRQFHWMADVDWRNQGKSLQQNHQRRRERAHQRKAISRANQFLVKNKATTEKD